MLIPAQVMFIGPLATLIKLCLRDKLSKYWLLWDIMYNTLWLGSLGFEWFQRFILRKIFTIEETYPTPTLLLIGRMMLHLISTL